MKLFLKIERGKMPKTLKPPDKLLEMIQLHCEANNIAMAMIGSDQAGVCMILFGDRDFSPDQASVIAAEILLHGVTSGGFHRQNKEMVEQQAEPIGKDRIN